MGDELDRRFPLLHGERGEAGEEIVIGKAGCGNEHVHTHTHGVPRWISRIRQGLLVRQERRIDWRVARVTPLAMESHMKAGRRSIGGCGGVPSAKQVIRSETEVRKSRG
jgi:hypothetical protein